jgi:hypothetical protein
LHCYHEKSGTVLLIAYTYRTEKHILNKDKVTSAALEILVNNVTVITYVPNLCTQQSGKDFFGVQDEPHSSQFSVVLLKSMLSTTVLLQLHKYTDVFMSLIKSSCQIQEGPII